MSSNEQNVLVPRIDEPLAAVSADRVKRLHRHLVNVLLASQASGDDPGLIPLEKSELAGFALRVANSACSLCRGWCCTSGADDAFLGEITMTRVRRSNPELELMEIANLYVSRVPAETQSGSCIFHGRDGCTLDRSLRSDVCNDYYGEGLNNFLKHGDYGLPVVVKCGEGQDSHTSPILRP
jgi:hypothetical protein